MAKKDKKSDDKNITDFQDFIKKLPNEKEELKKVRRSFKKNDAEIGQKERKLRYNKVTRKLDDVGQEEIEDRLDKLEESSSFTDSITREQVEERAKKLYPEYLITTKGSKYDANGPRRVSYIKCWTDIKEGFYDS